MNRRRPLRKTKVGGTVHANLTIAVGQLRGPGNGVHAIFRLMHKRHPFTLRGHTSTCILHDDHVAPARYLGRVSQGRADGEVLTIRQARQQHRPATLASRAKDIGSQDDSIAHGGGHIIIDDDLLIQLHCHCKILFFLLPRIS